jgi:hydroxymethylpyrimidine/phosphomethylpyrimidine kinase
VSQGYSQWHPVALSIAGSDSGGGAGIQADLKVFSALGVHGATAITCLTAQNPRSVLAIQPCPPAMVRAQLEAVFQEMRPAAVKTGMLYSAGIVRLIADWFGRRDRPPLVVDPVMIATSRATLLKSSALSALMELLLPRATLITPNLDETGVLTGRKSIQSIEGMREAARQIHGRFGCAALIKGGHLPQGKEAVDVFYDGKTELLLSAPYVRGLRTHGTGCTYSAAITAYLALGWRLERSVAFAKEYVTQAIARSWVVHGHTVLNGIHPPASTRRGRKKKQERDRKVARAEITRSESGTSV